MQTQATQVTLPIIQIQVPPNQNEATNKYSETTKNVKKIVRSLGITTIFLSSIVFFMSIAEVATKACRMDGMGQCHSYMSWGVGIWCSVLPFIAGIFGVIAGSNSSSQTKNGLLMGFSIAGACTSFILIILQSIFTTAWHWEARYTDAKFILQIAILSFTGVNIILLIVLSAYSCCLCESCCCRQSVNPVEQRVIFTYEPREPNHQTLKTTGKFNNTGNYPQENKTLTLNKQQNIITTIQ